MCAEGELWDLIWFEAAVLTSLLPMGAIFRSMLFRVDILWESALGGWLRQLFLTSFLKLPRSHVSILPTCENGIRLEVYLLGRVSQIVV